MLELTEHQQSALHKLTDQLVRGLVIGEIPSAQNIERLFPGANSYDAITRKNVQNYGSWDSTLDIAAFAGLDREGIYDVLLQHYTQPENQATLASVEARQRQAFDRNSQEYNNAKASGSKAR